MVNIYNMIRQMMAAMALAAACLPAVAETKDINLSDTSRVYDLDEIFVVRQPKDQVRLRLQPLSSSMFAAQDISNLGVRDLRELSAYVPNFVMPQYGSRYTSVMYMRGTGSRVNSPSVGIYVDGVPLMSKSAFNHHTYNLQRVDVLRGPQATLYGLNSEAGLVRLYTKNPMDHQGTELKVGGGSHGYRNVELSTARKLSKAVGFSLAAFYEGGNGFFKNSFTGERADIYNEAGGRLKLVWRPTKQWDINLLADYQYTRQPNAFPYGELDEDGLATSPSTNVANNYRRNMLTTALDIHYAARAFDLTSTTSYQYEKDYMMMDIDYTPLSYMSMMQRQFQNSMTQEFTLKSRRPVGGVWDWTVGAFGGLSWLKTNSIVDFDEEMDAFLGNTIQSAMYTAMLNSMSARYIAAGMSQEAAAAQAATLIASMGGVSMETDLKAIPGVYRTPSYNLGLYHESRLHLGPRLLATLGLRYDWLYTRIDYATDAAFVSNANVMGTEAVVNLTSALNDRRHSQFEQLLPKVGLTWQLDNGNNVYATVSKGYRAGGYNIQMFSDILQAELTANSSQRSDYAIEHSTADYDNLEETILYKPETSWNYEAGTHLNLFGSKLQLDLSVFYMSIRNQQLSKMANTYGFGRMMTNAGKSMSCGIELSLRGRTFDDHLYWTASYGFTHAQFDEYTDSVSVNGTYTEVDYEGNKVPFVPQHTLAASADYRFDLPANGLLKAVIVGANVNALGRIYWDEDNSQYQNFYAVLGAHVGFDLGCAEINVWGRNLTNAHYNVFAVNSSATGTSRWFAQRGNPFQVGADLMLHF